MALLRRDAASASSVGLAVAAATVATAFVVAEIMVAPPAGLDDRATVLSLEAATAIDLIVREAGIARHGGSWGDDPDNVTRFGLTVDGRPNFLDYVKIKALRNGTLLSSGENRAPDYPEVRAALGLVNTNLHLRSYPVMPGVDDPRWSKDPHGRAAYFGHYSGASAPVTLSQSYTWTSQMLNVSLSVKNEATEDAAFVVAFSPGNAAGGSTFVTAERHTRLLAPGETQVVWHEFHKLDDWLDTIDAVKVEVSDPYGNIAVGTNGVTVGSFWFAIAPPEGSGNAYNLLLNAGAVYFTSGADVTFHVDHYDGDGLHVSGAKARFVLVGPNGAEWYNESVDLPSKKKDVHTHTCTNCTTVGNYTAIVWDETMTRKHVETVHVAAATMFAGKETLAPVAVTELTLVGDLVAQFNPTRYDAGTNPEGDLFGDDSNGPSNIAAVLDRYTMLIVGSEVSQTSLNSAQTKYAIADWVQAGGNLIVLGTYTQQSRWLEPLYHAAQETANGGISAPDPTHPILSAPNPLEYDRYLDRGRAWRIKEVGEFTHVLSRGEQGNNQVDDTLAVSAPGVFGNGTVVLTSYMPGALTDPVDPMEAKRLLHNLMSQGYTMLFLDYGPAIPEGVTVGSASRLVAVPHPNVPGAVVEVRLVLYLFG